MAISLESPPEDVREKLPTSPEAMQERLRELGWQHPERLTVVAPEDIPPNAFNTDKYLQGYMPVYEALRDELGTNARICEVGVWNGASLGVWMMMFPHGLIAGVDIEGRSFWPRGSHKVVCSQNDPELPGKLREFSPAWDLIIDDASHDGTLTAETFNNLWPLVRPGGYYVIEDWFYGWHEGQRHIYNMVDLARDLLDFLHGEFDFEEIRYRFGLIIIRKVTHNKSMPQILVELDKMARENPLRVGGAEASDSGMPGIYLSGHRGYVAAEER